MSVLTRILIVNLKVLPYFSVASGQSRVKMMEFKTE